MADKKSLFGKLVRKLVKKDNEIKPCPEEGIFVLKGQVNNDMACEIIKGMFEFSKRCPGKTITLYINSEGGYVTSGMAVYDTMRALQNPIRTIAYECVGGISSLLLATGTQGMREALQGTRISIGSFLMRGDSGQPSELLHSALEKVMSAFALQTGNTQEQIRKVIGEKEWLSVKQAMQIGLIDALADKD